MHLSAHRRVAARGPDRGGALQRLWGAVYGAKYLNGCADCDVAEAPARGAVGRSRGGACSALIPRGRVCGALLLANHLRLVLAGRGPWSGRALRGGVQARLESARGAA